MVHTVEKSQEMISKGRAPKSDRGDAALMTTKSTKKNRLISVIKSCACSKLS